MSYNGINAAAQRKEEMNRFLRGKSSEQQAIIKFFYGEDGGCLSSGMTVEQYREKVRKRLAELDTKQMALRKLGIDEEEVQEVEPVSFEGYYINDRDDNFTKQASLNTWVSSDYQITWIFFGEQELFVYQYSFSMVSDSKRENTMQYFYQDVTNFTAASDTYQKWTKVGGEGCLAVTETQQVSVDAEEFRIVVPGDKLRCSMTPTDATEASIRAMRNKLREMKNRSK